MSNSERTKRTKKMVKKALIGATVLATSPVWAKGGGGGDAVGKASLGVTHLSLDESPGQNATVCSTVSEGKNGSNLTPNDIDIAVDPFKGTIELVFTVRDLLASNTEYMLILAYSPQLTPEGSPEIPTPKSLHDLRLSMAGLELLAIYQVPKQDMLYQDSTRLGRANPAPHSAFTFTVNLDTGVLPVFMNDKEKAYVQAALLSKEDYDAGRFDAMILSELDSIGFVEYQCPEGNYSAGMDDGGTMTVTDTSGNTTKTTVTASAEAGATTVTK
jgi:hypothetical protein